MPRHVSPSTGTGACGLESKWWFPYESLQIQEAVAIVSMTRGQICDTVAPYGDTISVDEQLEDGRRALCLKRERWLICATLRANRAVILNQRFRRLIALFNMAATECMRDALYCEGSALRTPM